MMLSDKLRQACEIILSENLCQDLSAIPVISPSFALTFKTGLIVFARPEARKDIHERSNKKDTFTIPA
jgi:hypothetical protein